MKISIIAAMTKDRVIGQGNKMPWHIPAELQNFKAITMGKPMIMGRATFDSIGRRLLPGRQTIILSKHPIVGSGFILANSIEGALLAAGDVAEVMIVGGATIYQQFLPLADKMYLSIIPGEYSGDVLFPDYDILQWRQVAEEIKPEFKKQVFERLASL